MSGRATPSSLDIRRCLCCTGASRSLTPHPETGRSSPGTRGRPETRASWWFVIPAFTPQAMSKPFGRRLPVETIRPRRGTGNPSGFHRPERRRRGANPEKTAVLALEARYLGGNLRSDPISRDFLRLGHRQTLPLRPEIGQKGTPFCQSVSEPRSDSSRRGFPFVPLLLRLPRVTA